ncbi:TetR/AcrR family transcriptional regulator [Frankia sp. R43]|uniref:TetR/AcrR family transcriptional regulator n=1 Tax=Frankia sp. R43 TaxID=269536 RepID=UPI0009F9D251|nr:TetR/AcrR family transcriptional regulator [Frankia sp. R43]
MTVSGTKRVYGGVAGEERIAGRRQKLIEAGMNLFGSSSSEPVRVKDVCVEAKLTERYFYESFSDLDDLFQAVLDATMDSIDRDIDAALGNAPEDGMPRITVALRASLDSMLKDPRKIRILYVEGLGKGGRAAPRRHELMMRSAENFYRWSGADPAAFASTSTEEAVVKAIMLSGAASELLVSWAEGLIKITPERLADALVGLYWRLNLP